MGKGLMAAGVLLALALIAVGCGDSSTDPSAISKEAFIKKADAVCKRGSERMQAGIAAYLKKEGKKGLATLKHPSKADYDALFGKVVIPNVEREIKEIEALGAPSGDEDRISAIIDALEEGIETAENDPKAVISSSDAIFGIASRLAGEYGLEVCGSR